MKMCLDCGEVAEFEGDTHHLCPTPSRDAPSKLMHVRIEECPRSTDRRTKRYRETICEAEHHHYGRGDHVVILTERQFTKLTSVPSQTTDRREP